MMSALKKAIAWVMSFGLDNDRLAQIGHFLAGVVVGDWFGIYGCLIFFGAWVMPKEAVLDPRPPENAPFFWDGAKDAGFYCLGMAVGMVRRLIL